MIVREEEKRESTHTHAHISDRQRRRCCTGERKLEPRNPRGGGYRGLQNNSSSQTSAAMRRDVDQICPRPARRCRCCNIITQHWADIHHDKKHTRNGSYVLCRTDRPTDLWGAFEREVRTTIVSSRTAARTSWYMTHQKKLGPRNLTPKRRAQTNNNGQERRRLPHTLERTEALTLGKGISCASPSSSASSTWSICAIRKRVQDRGNAVDVDSITRRARAQARQANCFCRPTPSCQRSLATKRCAVKIKKRGQHGIKFQSTVAPWNGRTSRSKQRAAGYRVQPRHCRYHRGVGHDIQWATKTRHQAALWCRARASETKHTQKNNTEPSNTPEGGGTYRSRSIQVYLLFSLVSNLISPSIMVFTRLLILATVTLMSKLSPSCETRCTERLSWCVVPRGGREGATITEWGGLIHVDVNVVPRLEHCGVPWFASQHNAIQNGSTISTTRTEGLFTRQHGNVSYVDQTMSRNDMNQARFASYTCIPQTHRRPARRRPETSPPGQTL